MTKWNNRIIGHEDVPLSDILFNPRNWRIHPMNQQNALMGVLQEVGVVQNIIINKRTGNLVDGHLRCQLADRNGEKTVSAVIVDLSEEEEALVLSTLDPLSAMAITDKQKLDELFADIQSENDNVNKLIADISEKEGMIGGLPTLDDLESKYGEFSEGDLWPTIRLQVDTETYNKYQEAMKQAIGGTEAEKFNYILSQYVSE